MRILSNLPFNRRSGKSEHVVVSRPNEPEHVVVLRSTLGKPQHMVGLVLLDGVLSVIIGPLGKSQHVLVVIRPHEPQQMVFLLIPSESVQLWVPHKP